MPRRRGRKARKMRSFLGFEIETELLWRDWTLGREFTKILMVRNTQSKLQSILFTPPRSESFTSLARQKIPLSPLTSFPVPVTFKPSQWRDYEDAVELRCGSESFRVPLRATTPRAALRAPESVLMPLCGVWHTAKTTLGLRNVGKVAAFFRWANSPPFVLSPKRGVLKPGQHLNITVTFQPEDALTFQATAQCGFGTQENALDDCCCVLLHGTAKYPLLEIKTPLNGVEIDNVPMLDFEGAVGQTLHKHFEIYNPSPFRVEFIMSRLRSEGSPLLGSVFGFSKIAAEVASGESLRATVSFSPTTANSTSFEYLSLVCKGSNDSSLLKLAGKCVLPEVSLSPSVVNFGGVEAEQTVTKTLDMVNSSLAQAVFQWDIDCSGHSLFSIWPAGGIVPPQSHLTLKVRYTPAESRFHYKKVACLILHAEPVFLNLVGNSEKPVQQLLSGMGSVPKPDREQDSAPLIAATPFFEYFLSCASGKALPSQPPPPLLSVAPNELVFNQELYTLPQAPTFQKPVVVISHCSFKLRLEWTLAPDSSFSVSPPFSELPARKTTSFRVTYSPKELNSLHGALLECFAFPVDGDRSSAVVLPLCASVRVIAHSYEPGKKHRKPQCSLEPRRLEFPAVNTASYRSFLLANKGDLPVTFQWNPELDQELAEEASMVVVPSCGLILPNSHQILFVRATATDDSPKEGFHIRLDLNASKQTWVKMRIISRAEAPYASLEAKGKLHFLPTAINSMTKQLYHVRNLSRQVLRFSWGIQKPQREIVSVDPVAGVLHPNDNFAVTWCFTPLEDKLYTFKPVLTISSFLYPDHDDLHVPVKVTGRGCVGFLEASEAVVEGQDVLVGDCQTISIPVVNNSMCAVSFHVAVEQKPMQKGAANEPHLGEESALQVKDAALTIAGSSTMFLPSAFTPLHQAQYTWTISYQMINGDGSLTPAKTLCDVSARGVYPTLQITDVCGRRSLSHFSKKQLWKLLSLDELNESLKLSPCPKTSRRSAGPPPPAFPEAGMDFNFGAAPLNSDPSIFTLMLGNPGVIPVEWTFLFPEDKRHLDFWAETGEFSREELKEMRTQDKQLFCVKPRCGELTAGEQTAVTFTYTHDSPGTNRFPALLRVSLGREIRLSFQGMTLDEGRPYLHFAPCAHVFTPVAIGTGRPPVQMYELYNQGTVPVQYEVDEAALSQIQERNFDHPVLHCLKPSGEIPPEASAVLEWIFSPLEAKVYQMDIPIRIVNGASVTVRFEGRGMRSHSQHGVSSSAEGRDHAPCGPRAQFPHQVTFLSEDSVDFEDIAVSSKSSKTLFLTNSSHSDIVCFEWVLPQSRPPVLDIVPARGCLSPGENVPVVVALFASEYPTIYQFDIICQRISEAALRESENAAQQKDEEGKQEVTVTDKAPKENKAEPFVRRCEACLMKRSPVRSAHECETVEKEPPKPCLFHLLVVAQSYELHEFPQKPPDQLSCPDRPDQTDKSRTDQKPKSLGKKKRQKEKNLCRAISLDKIPNPKNQETRSLTGKKPERNWLVATSLDKTQSQSQSVPRVKSLTGKEREKDTSSREMPSPDKPRGRNIPKAKSSTEKEPEKDLSSLEMASQSGGILEDAALADDLLVLVSEPGVYNPTPASSSSSKPASSDQDEAQEVDEEVEDGGEKVKPAEEEPGNPTEEIGQYEPQNQRVEVDSGDLEAVAAEPPAVVEPPGARTTSRDMTEDGLENN